MGAPGDDPFPWLAVLVVCAAVLITLAAIVTAI